MSIYEFNMQALQRRYPNVAEHVQKLKDDHSVQVVPTRNKHFPTAKVKVGEQDWWIHSKEDPQAEAHAFVDTVLQNQFKYANVVVVLGIGLGYHLEPLFKRYAGTDTFFILVENNFQIFKKFLQSNRPIVNANGMAMSIFDFPGMSLMVGVPPQQVYSYLFDIMMKTGRNSHSTFYFVEHPILIRFNKDYYKPVCQEINRVCYDIRSSYGNDPEDSWIGIDHMLQNLDQISSVPGIIQLKDEFKDIPAVIVATGPSLNKNIDLLPEIKDKAVFFAADASLNTFLLHEPQIVPDIVCSLERNLSTANHFNQIKDKESMKDIWLCACPVVMPHVYNAWQGKDVTLYRDFAHFTWLGVDKGKLNTGKSVTNMAFKAALYLGCNPIILVGQDLAFAPDGQSHVKGADHARDGLKKSQLINQRVKVMGNDGNTIDSLDTWLGMLKRFEFDIAQEGGRIRVVNATEGGARIEGTECMTLREVIDQFCTKDVSIRERLNKMLEYPTKEQMEQDKATIEKNVLEGIAYLKKSYDLLDDTLNIMEEAAEHMSNEDLNMNEVEDIFNYCDKVKKEVLANEMCFVTAMHVIQSWCMGRENIFRTIPDFYKDREQVTDKFLKIFEFYYGLRKLYKMMLDGVQENYDRWKGVSGVSKEADSSEHDVSVHKEEGLGVSGVCLKEAECSGEESSAGECGEGKVSNQ